VKGSSVRSPISGNTSPGMSDGPPVPILQCSPVESYLSHREEIDAAVRRVMEGGVYILGDEVERLEQEFATYIGVRYGVGVASGTDAIECALRVLGVGPGDEVVTVSHTPAATISGIERCGAIPVLVDIDPRSFNIDPDRVEDALIARGPRVKAVLAVHLYGNPADMPRLLEVARHYGKRVVEDCAQAHGAAIGQRRVGAWGDLATFSFYPTKNLGALGDAGMVLLSDPDLRDRLMAFRQYGWRNRDMSETAGINSRLDELQAAVLRIKLRRLDGENVRRRTLAAVYDESLSSAGFATPVVRPATTHVYHQYVIRSASRDALRGALQDQRIQTAVHYPTPVHRQPAYQGRLPISGDLRVTEAAAREVVSLPMYPGLPLEAARRVSDCIIQFATNAGS
jgi:dTDP-4-amino-4,6-dideoxygalactose transaminase